MSLYKLFTEEQLETIFFKIKRKHLEGRISELSKEIQQNISSTFANEKSFNDFEKLLLNNSSTKVVFLKEFEYANKIINLDEKNIESMIKLPEFNTIQLGHSSMSDGPNIGVSFTFSLPLLNGYKNFNLKYETYGFKVEDDFPIFQNLMSFLINCNTKSSFQENFSLGIIYIIMTKIISMLRSNYVKDKFYKKNNFIIDLDKALIEMYKTKFNDFLKNNTIIKIVPIWNDKKAEELELEYLNDLYKEIFL